MGSKRVGLARTQALIENLKRDLDLKGSDMKLRSENSQLAVSEDGYGVYEAVFEVDFGNLTPTATNTGLLATVCTLPDNARILSCNLLTSEAFSTATRSLNLVTTAAAAAANDTITASTTLIDGLNMSGGSSGAVGSPISCAAASSAVLYVADITEQLLVFINKGTGNDTTKLTTGKIIVHIKYLGSGPATALTTVRGS